MTKKEFYEALRNVAGQFDWEICDYWHEAISGHKKDNDAYSTLFCPITAVAYASGKGFFKITDYKLAGQSLGLSKEDTNTIAHAADYDTEHPAIRQTLLESIAPQA